MSPTLTQLAALVPLDPTTLVLLSLAFMPAAWTPRLVRPALKGSLWLRVPLVTLLLTSLALPVLPWPLIALANLLLFLEAFRVATQRTSSRGPWTALFCVAGAWSFQTFRTFWQTFLNLMDALTSGLSTSLTSSTSRSSIRC